MRAIIRSFDHWLASVEGVFPFSDDPECILRLQEGRAPHQLPLPEGPVNAGEPVLFIHLWNERLPLYPPSGPDLSWAALVFRRFIHSLQLAARYLRSQPQYHVMRAIGGVSVLLPAANRAGQTHPLVSMGFTLFPYRSRLGSFGIFWENFYSWWVMWAYNPASHQGRSLFSLQRTEMWMHVERFLQRYGREEILKETAPASGNQ
jgi:hypothetical protein